MYKHMPQVQIMIAEQFSLLQLLLILKHLQLIVSFWTVYESSSTYTNSYEFKLTPNGVLQFDNTQVNANDLLKSQISECIASEMLRVSREVYPDALSNRSVRGIANELVVHYLLSDIVERAKVADMGDTKKTARGYDRNAWIFEALN